MNNNLNNNYNLISHRLEKISNMLINANHIEPILDSKYELTVINNFTSKLDIREVLPKKYIDFSIAINNLGGKLLYIKSGSTGHTFKGVFPQSNNENNNTPYAVKIVAYPKKVNYGDIYNVKRPENTELLMIKLLSYFVINNNTPHIILPITTFNTSIKPFLNLTKNNIINNKRFEQFIERYENGEYYQNVSVLVSEWANNGDLLDFLKKNYKQLTLLDWTVIFFQIISVLAIIQNKYPTFRHNDMKANNILIHKIDIDQNNKNYLYKINNKSFIIPNIGLQIKLWDFDFACIPNIVNNSKVEAEWTNKINIKPEMNKYYDIHYFFSTLTKKGFFPELLTNKETPNEILEFINRVIPDKYKSGKYVSERGRLLENNEFITPDKLLNDILFTSMKKN